MSEKVHIMHVNMKYFLLFLYFFLFSGVRRLTSSNQSSINLTLKRNSNMVLWREDFN